LINSYFSYYIEYNQQNEINRPKDFKIAEFLYVLKATTTTTKQTNKQKILLITAQIVRDTDKS